MIQRVAVTIPGGNHTAGTFLELVPSQLAGYELRRILLVISGMTGNGSIALFEADAGKGTLTNAEMAAGQVLPPTAVAPAADPTPEVNTSHTLVGYLRPATGGNPARSLYLSWKANVADAATAVQGALYLES